MLLKYIILAVVAFGTHLDFPDFLQKKFYNINFRSSFGIGETNRRATDVGVSYKVEWKENRDLMNIVTCPGVCVCTESYYVKVINN